MPDRRAYVTLLTLSGALPTLLRRWRELENGDNPFLGLYAFALLHEDLPDRARYLLLVQALEALHGFEHHRDEDRAQRRFARKREDLLDEVAALHASKPTLAALSNLLGKTRRPPLAGRLNELINALPSRTVGTRSNSTNSGKGVEVRDELDEHGEAQIPEEQAAEVSSVLPLGAERASSAVSTLGIAVSSRSWNTTK
jgi:hypothetical protein